MNLLSVVPLVGVALGIAAFFTSYIVAVARGDVYPWWPYISDTGTTVPESCIFGELLSLTAFFAFGSMIIRYKWVQRFGKEVKGLDRLNSIALTIGILSCFFMTMVANFQETSVRAVHMPSSALTFGFGLAYNFLHAEITRKMVPQVSSVLTWVLRLGLCVLGILAFGLLYGFGVSATNRADWSKNATAEERLEWHPHQAGWGLHVVSAISEWIIGISAILFFLTFSFEFCNFSLHLEPELVTVAEDDDAAPLTI